MPTYQDLLPASRSHPRRGLYWTPCPAECPADGRLEITRGRSSSVYLLAEVYAAPGYGPGRAFTLRKTDGTVYQLFLADDRPRSTCDCPGHTYAAAEKVDRRHGDRYETLGCCQLDALDSIVNFNRWLPESRANAGQDVGATEVTDQELPECFRGCGPSPDGCPF